MRRKVRSFDRIFSKIIASLPKWMRPIVSFASWLGEPAITFGIAATVMGMGIGQNHDTLIIVGATAIIAISIASLLKLILRRKRPTLDYPNKLFFDTFSFPSGHAAGSTISYGLIALLCIRYDLALTAVAIPIVALLIVAIGISRVYLNAHYPSDVVGGWIIGLGGLAFILIELYS